MPMERHQRVAPKLCLSPQVGSTISFGGSQNIRYSRYVERYYCKSDEVIIGCTAHGNAILAHGVYTKSVLAS
jgi:hypothetical protein